MASDQDDSIKTVVTCEGNISDPDFPIRLSSLLARLRRLLFAGNKPFRVTNVEPWNSVRVTFNIPREAAYRLRLLAQTGDRVLRELGILSVQIEGDQVISLTIAGRFNEPQEIILQPVDDDQVASTSGTSTFNLGSLEMVVAAAAVTTKSQHQSPSSSGLPTSAGPLAVASTSAVAVASTSSAVSGPDSFPPGAMAPPPVDFKSPNVVAPGSEPIPFPPKGANNPLANPHLQPPLRNHPTAFGPFPFASMTHAMNTMHGSQGHHPATASGTTATPAPAVATTAPAARFSLSSSLTFHHPGTGAPATATATTAAGSGPFQPVRPGFPPSSSASVAATVAAVAAGGGNVVASPTVLLNNLPRGVVDRANAALMSPLLVNLLQSDMSGTTSSGQSTPGKAFSPVSAASVTSSDSSTTAAPPKRKRKPRKPKEKPPFPGSLDGTTVTPSPRASPLHNPSPKSSAVPTAVGSTATTATAPGDSNTITHFAQPYTISATAAAVPSIPFSPPSLTPPSASPPSVGPPLFTSAVDGVLAAASKVPPPPPSHSFVVGCQQQLHHHLHRHPTPQPQHQQQHRVPPLPSPPPTAPSSSASTSNNSGQSSQEAEHELSPWPSPAPAGKRPTQHLVNPFTGQLEPMSSEEDEEEELDDEDEDDDDDFDDSSMGDGAFASSNEGLTTPLHDSGSSSASSTTSSYRSDQFVTAVERSDISKRGTLESGPHHRLDGASLTVTGRDQVAQPAFSSAAAPASPSLATSSVGSPSEKIKLRLKLESKERSRGVAAATVPDKPKPPKVEPAPVGSASAAHQYKVDVSFVNIPTRRVSGGVGGTLSAAVTTTVGGGSAFTSPATSPSIAARSGSPTGSLCYGIAGSLSTTPEPRVPPLHISLRGRNAAVVTSPRRGEKGRGRGRGGEMGERSSRGLPATANKGAAKGRVTRGGTNISKVEGARGLVPVMGGGAVGATFRVATMAGRRASNARGAANSRRGRGAGNLLATGLLQSNRVAASVIDSTTNSQQESIVPVSRSSPPVVPSPSVSPPAMSEGRTSVSPSGGGGQQQSGRREQTLLSGGSLVLDSHFPAPPPSSSPASTPAVSTTTTAAAATVAAQAQHVQVPNVLHHPSKNLQGVATTVVSSVQIPRRDSDPNGGGHEKIQSSAATGLPHALPPRRLSLHDRDFPGSAHPVHQRPISGQSTDGPGVAEGSYSRAKDILKVDRGEVLTRFGIKVKNIGQHHHRGTVVTSPAEQQQQHQRLPDVLPSTANRERTTKTGAGFPLPVSPPVEAGPTGSSTEQQQQTINRPDDRLQPLVVRGVKMVALPEATSHAADTRVSSLDVFSSPAPPAVRPQRISDDNPTQRSEPRSPVVRQIVLDSPKLVTHPHLPPTSASATVTTNARLGQASAGPESLSVASWTGTSMVDKYYHHHVRHRVHVVDPAATITRAIGVTSTTTTTTTTTTTEAPKSATKLNTGSLPPMSGTLVIATPVSDLHSIDESRLGARVTIHEQMQRSSVTLRTSSVVAGAQPQSSPPSLTSIAAAERSPSPGLPPSSVRVDMSLLASPTQRLVPDVPFSQVATPPLPEVVVELDKVSAEKFRDREQQQRTPFDCRRESGFAGDSAGRTADVPSVESWVHSCAAESAIVEEDEVTTTAATDVGPVQVPCGDAATVTISTATAVATTTPTNAAFPRAVVARSGNLTQEKLRLVSAIAPAGQLVSAGGGGGGDVLEGVVQVRQVALDRIHGHHEEDDAEFMTREVANHHHHHRRHHHHHILSAAIGAGASPATAVSIVTVSSSSPCSASPSGSSPDSLNAGTSSEENGDHAPLPVGRGHGGPGTCGALIRHHRRVHPGSLCNSTGSPYEDSGIESMDATGLEKLPGNESPGDAPDAGNMTTTATNNGGYRPTPPLPPPPDSGQSIQRDLSGDDSVPTTTQTSRSSAKEGSTSTAERGESGRRELERATPKELEERPGKVQIESGGIDESLLPQLSDVVEVGTINNEPNISSMSTETKVSSPPLDVGPTLEAAHDTIDSSADIPASSTEVSSAISSTVVASTTVATTETTEAGQEFMAIEGDVSSDKVDVLPSCFQAEMRVARRSVAELADLEDCSSEDGHLLTSVVFPGSGGEDSLDLVGRFASDALGEDDLGCVSPTDQETTQLLVFTVEDVDSIVMNEGASNISLLDAGQHHQQQQRRHSLEVGTQFADGSGTSSALHFSSLDAGHHHQLSHTIGDIEAHLQETDALTTVNSSIAAEHLDNCVDAREGLTVVQVQLSNATNEENDKTQQFTLARQAASATTSNRSTTQSNIISVQPTTNHAPDNSPPTNRQMSCSPTSTNQNASLGGGCSPDTVVYGGGNHENNDDSSSAPIKFVSRSPGGVKTQLLSGGGGHGGASENGEVVAVSMPPTPAALFQGVSPVKLVMSRLRHPVCCASCTSSTVTLTTVLVKSSQGGAGGTISSPPTNAVSQMSTASVTTPLQRSLTHTTFVPNLVPLNALSTATITSTAAPPLVRLALSGGGSCGTNTTTGAYSSSDSVLAATTATTTITTTTMLASSGVPIFTAHSAAPTRDNDAHFDPTPVKTQSVTGATYSSPVTSSAPTARPPLPSSDWRVGGGVPGEANRRRDSSGSDSDTSGSVLSGASFDGVYRRPPRDGGKDLDQEEVEDEEAVEDDCGPYGGNISITSGDHNYIFRASRPPPPPPPPPATNRPEQRPNVMMDRTSYDDCGRMVDGGQIEVALSSGEDEQVANDLEAVVAGCADEFRRVSDTVPENVDGHLADLVETDSNIVNVDDQVAAHAEEEEAEGDPSYCVVDVPTDGATENGENAVVVVPTADEHQENGPVNDEDDDDMTTGGVTDNEVAHSEEECSRPTDESSTTADDVSLGVGGDNKFGSLTIEIPLDLEVNAEVERRSTRSTRSSSRLASPGGRLSCLPQASTLSPTRPNSRSSTSTITTTTTTIATNDIDTTHESNLRTLPSRSAAKRKREDSDSESERLKARSSTPALVLATAGPLTPVSLDREGGGATALLDAGGGLELETKGPSPTDATANQFFTKPVKRKCSENAVELIKACIGVDDGPKRPATKLPPPPSGVDGRLYSNRCAKANKEEGGKTKGANSASGVSEESSDDEVTLSELVTKVRSTKGRPATSHAEDRSVTRNSKQRQNAKEDEEVVVAAAGGTIKGEKAACRVNSRRDDGRTVRAPAVGIVVGAGSGGAAQRESRKEERISARLGGRIVAEKGRRVSPPPAKGSERSNHRAKAKEERPASPTHNAKEEPDGKRKLRSSGSSGYYDSLPQKRRRFSRDHR